MSPWRLADEARQKLRRRDGATVAAAGVLHVGEFRVDQLVVFGRERHSPQALTGRLAGGGNAARQSVIVAEQAGMFLTERDHDGARQGRQINHEFWLVLG